MKRSLHWVGRIAAVVSALVLAGGYVASRAVPGLFHSVQVYGAEGGGRAMAAEPGGEAAPASKTAGKSRPAVILPSSKYAVIADSASLTVGSTSGSQPDQARRRLIPRPRR